MDRLRHLQPLVPWGVRGRHPGTIRVFKLSYVEGSGVGVGIRNPSVGVSKSNTGLMRLGMHLEYHLQPLGPLGSWGVCRRYPGGSGAQGFGV